MLILTRYFGLLEQGYFSGPRGTADLIFFMVFNAGIMLFIAYIWHNFYVMGSALVFSALYVWSRKDPYREVDLWGFRFLAWHFPFVILVLAILGLGNPVQDILGLIVGHLYHFLTDIIPAVYGKTVISTPQFLYRLFETGTIQPPRPRWMQGQGHSLS